MNQDLNSPAIVMPEIGDVTEGMMEEGRECPMNQDVFEPESRRVRKGVSD